MIKKKKKKKKIVQNNSVVQGSNGSVQWSSLYFYSISDKIGRRKFAILSVGYVADDGSSKNLNAGDSARFFIRRRIGRKTIALDSRRKRHQQKKV